MSWTTSKPWGWVARVDPATWRHESDDRGRMPATQQRRSRRGEVGGQTVDDGAADQKARRRLALKAIDLAEAGRSEPALALMRRVLELQRSAGGEDLRIEVWKARVLHLTGSSEQAAAVLMSMIERDPDAYYAWLELGQMYWS